jgi:hypothetical protein
LPSLISLPPFLPHLPGVPFNKTKKASDKSETFWFLTIYDPRSSTEFQCGARKGCELYGALYGFSDERSRGRNGEVCEGI